MVRLAAHGLLVTLLLGCSGPEAARAPEQAGDIPAEWSLESDATALRFGSGGRARFVYCRGTDGLKPYLGSLVTPSGVEVLRDAPPDHEHHHGLMLALGVDDVDFWGERYAEVPGRQEGAIRDWRRVAQPGEEGLGWLTEEVRWIDPRDGRIRLEELRCLSFRPAMPGRPVGLSWWSRLRAPREREHVTLWGRHYFGLGLRLAEPFEGVGSFSHADGAEGVVVRGDERLTTARWCAYTARVDGRTVTVAMFDHPRNLRHPARFFTMAEPFAYLSATLDLEEHPLVLAPGEELALLWGLAVWEERVPSEVIEREYRSWVREAQSHEQAASRSGAAWKGDRTW